MATSTAPSIKQELKEDQDTVSSGVEELPNQAESSSTGSPMGTPTSCSQMAHLPPATKRPRLTSSSYVDILRPSQWTTRVKGKNSFGSPVISVWSFNGPVQFALYTDNEPRGTFPFKMDLECQNPPSFLLGTSNPSRSEGLDMSLTVTKPQKDFLEEIEAWIKAEALKNSKEWFNNKQHNKNEIEAMYSSVLKTDVENKYPSKVRAKVILAGNEQYLTRIVFLKNDGTNLKGAGWNFVKPLLGARNWQGHEARGIFELKSIWIAKGKFGPRLTYSHLLVKEKSSEMAHAAFPELEL